MNVEELVRDSLREMALEAQPAAANLADRVLVLRRRRRTRRIAAVAVSAAAVVTVAAAVPLLDGGGRDVRPAHLTPGPVVAHADQSPPRQMIGAGNALVAGYSTQRRVEQPNKDEITTRTYRLLDSRTGTYKKDDRWSFVTVAPGARTAAVLERELPAARVGLLDLSDGRVKRWIPVPQGAGGAAFSPDGSKLVVTTYAKNPDRAFWSAKIPVNDKVEPQQVPSRTGFTVVDVASGTAHWHELPYWKDKMGFGGNARADLQFSRDGKSLWEPLPMRPGRKYHALDGTNVPAPAAEKHVQPWVEAGLSPDGRLAAGDFAGEGDEIASAVDDAVTGKVVTKVPGQQLLAWADNKRLIAWGIGGDGNEFHQRLVLVTIGSKKVQPLSGFRSPKDDTGGRWEPLFTTR
ncbi:WD40 repeat domain-containing protein [Streptomyces sp. NPDC004658]|uniref:WD40 repeat domain-containing protein n=1 Tax=Streptomyces sp. NPDC004658 TaxID=3154672 RepID=UPI0033BC5DC7